MAAWKTTCSLLSLRKIISSFKKSAVLCSSLYDNSLSRTTGVCFRNYTTSVRHFSELKNQSTILSPPLLNLNINSVSYYSANAEKNVNAASFTTDDEKKSTNQFSKSYMKYSFIAFGAIFTTVAGIILYEWGAPHIDSEGNIIKDEFTEMPLLKAYILRTYKEMMYYDKMIKDPSREKLLPDPLTEPYYQPPYTLVLEMTGVLVHPDWTYQTGWRFKKRPGVNYFLQQIGPPLFEVVIFTSEQGFTAFPILDSLDPNGYIMYRLFRDATRYLDGHHVKDLSCLNRDLSKVIFLDWNDKSFDLQKENALKLKRWTGNDDDNTLYDLASFLRTIATSGVDDIRPILEYYGQFDDPIAAYKENQRKLQEEEEKRLKEAGKKSTLIGGMSNNFSFWR